MSDSQASSCPFAPRFRDRSCRRARVVFLAVLAGCLVVAGVAEVVPAAAAAPASMVNLGRLRPSP